MCTELHDLMMFSVQSVLYGNEERQMIIFNKMATVHRHLFVLNLHLLECLH